MTQKDKELLLKDLCARLPYGVKVLVDNKHWCDFDGHTPSKITFDNSYRLVFLGTELGYVKPYLFPLSSMTEEQTEELIKLINTGQNDNNEFMRSLCRIDFYHKHHFDYRGLISMDLAISATGLNIY